LPVETEVSLATSGAGATTATVTAASGATTTAGAASTTASAFAVTGTAELLLLKNLELFPVLNEGRLDEVGSGPQIGGEHGVGVLEGLESGTSIVLSGSSLTDAGGVDILETGEVEDLLGNLGGDATGTSGGRDHSDDAGAALALNLGGDGVDTTDSGAPIASSDGDELHLGVNEGALDGNLDFLANLDADTDVAHAVTASDDSLEAGALTGLGLLLDGEDAHDLVGKGGLGISEESLDNGGLLDGDGVRVNFLEGADVTVLNESTELGKRSPLLSSATAETTGSAATASTTAAVTATSTTTAASGAETSCCGSCC